MADRSPRRAVPAIPRKTIWTVAWIIYGIFAICLGAAGTYFATSQLGKQRSIEQQKLTYDNHAHSEHEDEHNIDTTIHMPKEKQRAAGIATEPVRRAEFVDVVRLTGKITLNENRLAHIHPLVAGCVHEVKVNFGDRVKAGQVLAVIDSEEVGRAKLQLYKSIMQRRLAEANYQWQKTINTNTIALINDLETGTDITQIEAKYSNLPMGEYRQMLLGAYAQYQKAQLDYKRIADVARQGIVAGKELVAAEAQLNAARATFVAAVEKIKFEAQLNELTAKQELDKARTTEAIDREILRIFGYENIAPEDIDPAVQGEAISHYEVKAPFDGTIIGRNIVLFDHVDPNTELFTLADFSTVWLKADIYEKHVPLLQSLAGKTIKFRTASYPGRIFEAVVFYTGSIVDEETRTVDMRAEVDNSDNLLKPGMFVELLLPGQAISNVLQVPNSAIQQYQEETFVFVQVDENTFQKRAVKLGCKSADAVEITDGLQEGEQVVVKGAFALKSEMLKAHAESGHAH